MAPAWQEWQIEFNLQQKPVMAEVRLYRLIAAEQSDRQTRSLNYQLHATKLLHHRDLINFNWPKHRWKKPASNN